MIEVSSKEERKAKGRGRERERQKERKTREKDKKKREGKKERQEKKQECQNCRWELELQKNSSSQISRVLLRFYLRRLGPIFSIDFDMIFFLSAYQRSVLTQYMGESYDLWVTQL